MRTSFFKLFFFCFLFLAFDPARSIFRRCPSCHAKFDPGSPPFRNFNFLSVGARRVPEVNSLINIDYNIMCNKLNKIRQLNNKLIIIDYDNRGDCFRKKKKKNTNNVNRHYNLLYHSTAILTTE